MVDTELAPGHVIAGRYRLKQRLGAGGMGAVYQAEDLKLGREVAVKVLREGFAADAERLARFEREARLLAAWCPVSSRAATGCWWRPRARRPCRSWR